MNILNKQQIQSIADRLKELGLTNSETQEEILDHLACLIEIKMRTGSIFSRAIKEAFEEFQQEEILQIQDSIQNSNLKSRRMSQVFLCFITALSGFLFLSHPLPEQSTAVTTITSVPNDQSVVDPPNGAPLPGKLRVNSAFGNRYHPFLKKKKFHNGVDFKASTGTPVIATGSGIILEVEQNHEAHGKRIIIQHDEIYQSAYSHLSKILVKKGQKIEKGDRIGLVGNTGKSTHPHLHYEISKKGEKVDPLAFVKP